MTAHDPKLSDAAFRAQHVGASEVAALFDASPWLTRFELHHRKAGTVATPDFNAMRQDGTPENERIHWGVQLERVIIDEACRRWGYVPVDTPHLLDNGAGLGGHPDQIVTDGSDRVVLEIKTTDWLVAKKWGEEPPLNYLLQNMAYQGLAGCIRGDMIVLVGGNELRRFQYEFRPALYAEIERRVTEFWQGVRTGDAPEPDFARDGRVLTEVLGEPDDTLADLRADNGADDLAVSFLQAKARAKEAEAEAEEAKNRLLLKIGSAGSALLGCHRIGCAQTKGSAGTLITADHVGTTIGARKGYRRFDVKEIA